MADDRVIQYIDRATGALEEETVYGEGLIKWAYQDAEMRGWRSWLFRSALPSRLLGWYFDSRLSRARVRTAIEQLKIDTREFRDPPESYDSFNAFFTRHLKEACRPWNSTEQELVSPADGRTLAYPCLEADAAIPIKGCRFTASELLQRSEPDFSGGTLIVIRLCPADYHRFHFPLSGRIVDQWEIPGAYHSVNPLALALGLNVFEHNKRSCCLLESAHFGTIGIVEVGAFGVGSIVQTYGGDEAAKMAEKGYFKFGGSTVILLLPKGPWTICQDLLANSRQGLETKLLVGEPLAKV